jgi:hypothetical protein|tara:strand:+ start:2792 stop:4759 length:1968 start_codon:yes stop_codon:yes gene_type:complete
MEKDRQSAWLDELYFEHSATREGKHVQRSSTGQAITKDLHKFSNALLNALRVRQILQFNQELLILTEKLAEKTNEGDLIEALNAYEDLLRLHKSRSNVRSKTDIDIESSLTSVHCFVRNATSSYCQSALVVDDLVNVLHIVDKLVRIELHHVVEDAVTTSIRETMVARYENAQNMNLDRGQIPARVSMLPLNTLYETIRSFLSQLQTYSKERKPSEAVSFVFAAIVGTWSSLVEKFLVEYDDHLKTCVLDNLTIKFDNLVQLDTAVEDIVLVNRICKAQHVIFVKFPLTMEYDNPPLHTVVSQDCREVFPVLHTLAEYYVKLEEKHFKVSMQTFYEAYNAHHDGAQNVSLDDVFFVIGRSTRRAFALTEPHIIATILRTVNKFLTDFSEQTMKVYLNQSVEVIAEVFWIENKGMSSTSNVTAGVHNAVLAMNATSTMSIRIQELIKDVECMMSKIFTTGFDTSELTNSLVSLRILYDELNSWHVSCVSNLVRERLNQLSTVCEQFARGSYIISEEAYQTVERTESWVSDILVFLLHHFRVATKVMIKESSELFIQLASEGLSTRLENIVKTRLSFNHLGALKFERELRVMISGLSGASSFRVRENFARLTQLSVVLSAETQNEVENYLVDMRHQSSWKLSESDAQKIVSLRVDLA